MNPLRLLVLLVSLPLLLGGCGEKATVEPVAEVKPKFSGVDYKELKFSGVDEIAYHKGSPYTGKAINYYENGQKRFEANWKNGKKDGLGVTWHENGQKEAEANFKDGKRDGLYLVWYESGQKKAEASFKADEMISEKFWNSKGEPVDSEEEAEAE